VGRLVTHFRANGKRLAVFASFEFDLGTRELKKSGVRFPLEEKPARALVRLLENSDILVERAELVQLLWPNEAHGDFDHRLNKVINKLRFILGDDPSQPRFIQTLSRRGYRFVAQVQIIETTHESLFARSDPGRNDSPAAAIAGDVEPPPLPVKVEPGSHSQHLSRPWWRSWRVAVSNAVVLAALLALLAGFGTRAWKVVASRTVRRSFAVADFRNLTGNQADAWLPSAMSDWLTTDLAAGEELRAIPGADVTRAQKDLGLATTGNFSPETLRTFGESLGADLVITGAIASVPGESGSNLRLDVRAQEAASGKVLCSLTLVGSRSAALQLASEAGVRLRSGLGLPALSPQALGFVQASVPANPDAARLYAEGITALQNYDAVEASALLLQASSIEPQHAPTHAALAATWTALGYDARARVEAESAFRGAKNLPREQQLLMEGLFRETTREWGAAANAYAEIFRLHPDDIDYGLKLANAQVSAGKAILALGTVQAMRQLRQPSNEDPRIDLTEAAASAATSDFKRQLSAAARAESQARKLGAKLLVAHAELEEGSALRSLGNLPQALQLWHQARETFAQAGDRRGIAKSLNDEGVLLWQKGDGPAAMKAFQESIAFSRATGDRATLAFALSRLGIVEMYSGKRNPAEAKRFFHEALQTYRQVENVQEQAYIISLIADELMQHNQLADAKKTYEESLALSRVVNDRSRIAGRLMDIGIIDTVQGDLDGATDSLQKSLSIYRELGERNRVAVVQNRLAMVLLWQGKISQAASTIESSLAIAREIGEEDVVAEMYENQAYIQMEQSPDKAASSALAAMDRHKANGDKSGAAMDAVILAQARMGMGNYAESRALLDGAFQVLSPNPSAELGIQMFVIRGQLHAHHGDLIAARMDLRRALTAASHLGAGSVGMEARLAMAELELKSRDKNARHDLDSLLRDASRRGFGLITAQATRALHNIDLGNG
jgi:eukaryotic-like serine/threonine-protein kinase